MWIVNISPTINTYTHTAYLNTVLNMPLLMSGSIHNRYNQAAAEVAEVCLASFIQTSAVSGLLSKRATGTV